MRLPLLSVSATHSEKDGGNFMYIECNDHSFSCSPLASSPRITPVSPQFNFEPFKHLLHIVEDKVKLLTDDVDHLREEINEKNATIKKLIDFINKIVQPKGLSDTDEYNDSVGEYNEKVAEYNLGNQRKNITTRKRKRPNECDDALETEESVLPPTIDTQASDEITFLRNEIAHKNRVIEFLTRRNDFGIDPTHRTVFDEEEDDDLEEQEFAPVSMDDDTIYDHTLEIMERLFIEDMPPGESTHHSVQEAGNESLQPSVTETMEEYDDQLENDVDDDVVVISNDSVDNDVTSAPEEEPTSYEDRINERIDKIEQMILQMNQNGDDDDDEMLSVAPWDKHGNGFASSYMKKNGHKPGTGLGKTGNGIIQPIPSEKKTFDTTKTNSVTWPKGTILIAGASMIQGLDETKMSRTGRVKVRSHGGATILDMHDHLNAILRKKPDHLIIHAHSNDASDKETTADDMFDRLMDLKSFSEDKVPNVKVTISCPILRTDNAVANNKQIQLKNRLMRSGLAIIVHDDIVGDDLGRKGLHLKPSGSRKLAKNIIDYLRNV